MAIYLDKLQTKLNALQAKNLDEILAYQVYLPFLGDNYNRAQLENWLNKRIDRLSEALNLSENQINTRLSNLYNSLSESDKTIADQILDGEEYHLTPSDADNYDKLVGIILYKFITTE